MGALQITHTISIDNRKFKTRLQNLITGCTDPFAVEIRYHPVCWRNYISNTKDEVEDLPYQNVQVKEVKQLFLNYAKNVIFEKNEPRTLDQEPRTQRKSKDIYKYGMATTSLSN